MGRPARDPDLLAGDLIVASMAGGSYQVSRVGANGRSEHVLGHQRDRPSALGFAARAASGEQRVFLRERILARLNTRA
jgi:hypothetical protein